MTTPYILHYAPDNASLIVRIALEMIGAPYRLALVDRSTVAQQSPEYLALNPLGMIPALETPDGVIFETGAILLWLADRNEALFPMPQERSRGDALKWLFFISNSLHSGLRQMFYPEKYVGEDHVADFRSKTAKRVRADFAQLDQLVSDPNMPFIGGEVPTLLDIYICTCLRWSQIYPAHGAKSWNDIDSYPSLRDLAALLERHAAVKVVQRAEGLGDTPFSAPTLPNPPIGSAT